MIEDRHAGPPHAAIVAAVLVAVVLMPTLFRDQREAVTDFIAELLGPVGLLLLPIGILLTVQFLSSDTGSFIAGLFSSADPNSMHRAVGGFPIGVVLFFLLVLLLLYNRIAIFAGDDE